MDEYEARLGKVRDHLAPLREFLEGRRRIEQGRLAKALQSARYRTLIRSWEKFLDEPVPEKTRLPNAKRPILDVASEQIERRFRRVLKKGRRIKTSSPSEALHRLRIECKKLRYLLEFFRTLYEADDLEALVKALKSLQDNLGNFNDLRLQQAAMRRFDQQMAKEGMATGELRKAIRRVVEWLETRQVKERKRFDKQFAKFSQQKNRRRLQRLVGTQNAIAG
jgi:CHAD domain-containing protein